MSSYTNCLLQGYGVLPGPPSRLHLTNIDTDYAVVHWAPPATLADTVQYYNVHYNTLQDTDDFKVTERVSIFFKFLEYSKEMLFRKLLNVEEAKERCD